MTAVNSNVGYHHCTLTLLILLFAACRGEHPTQRDAHALLTEPSAESLRVASEAARSEGAATNATVTEMRNVDLRIMPGAVAHLHYLSGVTTPTKLGQPVRLDDKRSYVIHVRDARLTLGYADLSRVLNEYTFAFEGAPVKDLRVSREGDEEEAGEIQLEGHLRRGLGMPFEIEGRPEVSPDGRIRIRTTSVQLVDLDVSGLLDALGLTPGKVLGNLEDRGLTTDGEDLILDPSRALPPPRVVGRLASVSVDEPGLTLTFGSPPEQSRDDQGPNYLWFHEGTIRIGKMTQRDADLRIVDEDPHDPFDFYADRMTDQLAAGFAKLGKTGALTLFVPDYGDIR